MLDVDPRALSVADLDECDAVNAALAAPAAASRLGGHVGFKMGWKGAFAKRASLFGPLFGVGMIRSGASVSLSAHKIFCAEAEFGFVFDKKLEARATAYSEEEVWGAVRSVELCVELCGARQHASASKLDYVADALPRRPSRSPRTARGRAATPQSRPRRRRSCRALGSHATRSRSPSRTAPSRAQRLRPQPPPLRARSSRRARSLRSPPR